MDGNEDTLEQLKAIGGRLRTQTTSIAFLPGLLDAIDEVERQYVEPPQRQHCPILFTCSPVRTAWPGPAGAAPRDQARVEQRADA